MSFVRKMTPRDSPLGFMIDSAPPDPSLAFYLEYSSLLVVRVTFCHGMPFENWGTPIFKLVPTEFWAVFNRTVAKSKTTYLCEKCKLGPRKKSGYEPNSEITYTQKKKNSFRQRDKISRESCHLNSTHGVVSTTFSTVRLILRRRRVRTSAPHSRRPLRLPEMHCPRRGGPRAGW